MFDDLIFFTDCVGIPGIKVTFTDNQKPHFIDGDYYGMIGNFLAID